MLNKITLYTEHLNQLSAFYSELFDTVPEKSSLEGVVFYSQGPVIEFRKSQGIKTSMDLEFQLEDDIDQFLMKTKYALYRHIGDYDENGLEIKQSEQALFFQWVDPDGRSWKFKSNLTPLH